jgi:hypothetical protein
MKSNKLAHACLLGIAALALALLAGCSTTASSASQKAVATPTAYASSVLGPSYADALDMTGQLALGTLRLEDGASAVTAQQAKMLLPLWQALSSGALQNQTETNAILKQIESAMTSEQVQAIAAMQLTLQDVRTWAESHGLDSPASSQAPEPQATLQAPPGGQAPDPQARETMQAQFGNMTDEQRAALRATAEASGQTLGGPAGAGGFAGGLGDVRVLVSPLIELLSQRAAGQ